jgi:hypothetical protein
LQRWGAIIAALCAVTCADIGDSRAQAASAEDAVKVTFIQRFASFVTWPEGAFASADAPIQICILGSEPFREMAQAMSHAQAVGGRPLVVRSIVDPAATRSCHIVYATGVTTDDALHAAQQAPVLTVTDAASHSGGRGIVHFVVVDNRVRFHIDDAQAANGQLTISSRLLALALSVRRRSGE